ncbi:MAG: asparagine synthase-related protein [candidate division KSB1 bacterium]|nr:asparagine synthase-related protein [candidate division KSB1 bacterium]
MATIQGDHLASRLQLHADGWIGLGALPARHEASRTYDDQFFTDDRLAVFFDGDLLNRASIAAASRISLETAREMSTPELIARCFEHRGPVLFEELDGIYRIIVWDFVDKKLYIANDRFAMMPMFYYQEGERIFFGSEIKFILKGIEALPGINVQAIADFLAFGSILNENTFFSGIRFVPREACVEITEDSIKEIPYSNRLDFTQSPGITQFEDACAHIRNAVMTGIRAYSGDHSAAVFLSGGISSRFLAAAEKRLRGHLQTFTFGADFSDDMEIAREVAIALNAEHETRVLAPERYIESFQRAVWLSDGLLDGGAGGLLSMMAGSTERDIALFQYGSEFLFSMRLFTMRSSLTGGGASTTCDSKPGWPSVFSAKSIAPMMNTCRPVRSFGMKSTGLFSIRMRNCGTWLQARICSRNTPAKRFIICNSLTGSRTGRRCSSRR